MAYNNHHHEVNARNMIFVIFLNFLITLAEVLGGLFANSLSLISDALHNLSDGIAILISYVALRLSRRKSTIQKTYGFKRAEILAALFNASVLIIIIFFLFKEALIRLFHPHKIDSLLMMVVAIIGLIANVIGVILLRKDAHHNLNIKSAYLHLIADSLSSIAVVIGSIIIKTFNFYAIDPILTIVIGIYILRESYSIIQNTVNILMQSTPENIDIMEIKCAIEDLPEIHNLHHVHIWQMTDKDIYFEGHIDVCDDYHISESSQIIRKIEKILTEKFGISHITIQIEFGTCTDKEIIKTC
jgi:cobalt-zinc-cadmium efflux system protein